MSYKSNNPLFLWTFCFGISMLFSNELVKNKKFHDYMLPAFQIHVSVLHKFYILYSWTFSYLYICLLSKYVYPWRFDLSSLFPAPSPSFTYILSNYFIYLFFTSPLLIFSSSPEIPFLLLPTTLNCSLSICMSILLSFLNVVHKSSPFIYILNFTTYINSLS